MYLYHIPLTINHSEQNLMWGKFCTPTWTVRECKTHEFQLVNSRTNLLIWTYRIRGEFDQNSCDLFWEVTAKSIGCMYVRTRARMTSPTGGHMYVSMIVRILHKRSR